MKPSGTWRALTSDLRVLSSLRRYSLSEVVDAELKATAFSPDAYDRQKKEVLRRAEQGRYADGAHAGKFLAQLKARGEGDPNERRPLFIPLVGSGSGLFVVSDIALATWILGDPDTFERAVALDLFADAFTLQNVFTTSDMKLRQALRRFFAIRTNGLFPHELASIVDIIQRRVDRMLSTVDPNSTISFISKVEGMVLEVYADVFFGMPSFPQPEECAKLIKKVWQLKSLRNNILFARLNPIGFLRMLWMRRHLFRIIESAQNLLQRTGSTAGNEMAKIYEEHGYPPGNIINALIPLYETISRAVSFALLELARAPLLQEKLRRGIVSYAGCDLRYCSSVDTLLHRVWQETLRLWPPTANQTRQVTTENNLLFPKGSKVVVVWSVFHRDMQVWGSDANTFNPERWLSMTRDQERNYRPFGSGPQNCVAADYASIGGKTILKRIVESKYLQLPEMPSPPIIADRAYSRGPDPNLSLLRFATLEWEDDIRESYRLY